MDTSWILQKIIKEKGWDYAIVKEEASSKLIWILYRETDKMTEAKTFRTKKAFMDYLGLV